MATYSLACAAGSYTLRISDTVWRDYGLKPDAGALALTGGAASLSRGRKIVAATEPIALTGIAAGLTAQRKMMCAVGSYLQTGQVAGLTKAIARSLVCAAGAYAVSSGVASSLVPSQVEGSTGHTSLSLNVADGPAGAGTADKITEDSAYNFHYLIRALDEGVNRPAGNYTFSVELKPDGRNWVRLSTLNFDCFVDLTNKTFGSSNGSYLSRDISDLGGGWVKVRYFYNAPTDDPPPPNQDIYEIQLATGDGVYDYQGDGSSGVLVGRVWFGEGDGSSAVSLLVNHALVCAGGSLNSSGTAIGLRAARKIAATTGSLALNGGAAQLSKAGNYSLSCAGGSYAVSISDRVTRDFVFAAGGGSFIETGGAVTFGIGMAAASGGYALTGSAANLRAARRISPAIVAFTLSGPATGVMAQRRIAAAGASYALTMKDAGLGGAKSISAAIGNYALTGKAAMRGLRFAAIGGSIVVNGLAASFSKTTARRLAADTGNYVFRISDDVAIDNQALFETGNFALSGGAASLSRGRVLVAAGGNYAVAGHPALRGLSMPAEVGSYVLAGPDIGLAKAMRKIMADGGSYTWRISDRVVPEWLPALDAASGSYVLTGNAALTAIWQGLVCESGAYNVTGPFVGLGNMQKSIVCAAGNYIVQGARSFSDFAMAADRGVFALNGGAATMAKAQWKGINANVGNYALAGGWAMLDHGTDRKIVAETGVYNFEIARQVAIEARTDLLHDGAYGVTGMPVNLIKGGISYPMIAEGGSYVLTGGATHRDLSMKADAGSFAVGGVSASLRRGLGMLAATGAYNWGAAATNLMRGRGISLAPGLFALTGRAADFSHGRFMIAAAGNYDIAGIAAGFVFNRMFVAGSGSFAVNGHNAALRAARRIAAASGNYVRTGNPVSWAYSVRLEAGRYTLNGMPINQASSRNVTAAGAAFGVSGNEAGMRVGRRLVCARGVFSVGGRPVNAPMERRLIAASGAYAQGGGSTLFARNRRILLASGAYHSAVVPVAYARSVRSITADGGHYKVEGEHINTKIGCIADIAHWHGKGHDPHHLHGRGPVIFIKGKPGGGPPFRGKE